MRTVFPIFRTGEIVLNFSIAYFDFQLCFQHESNIRDYFAGAANNVLVDNGRFDILRFGKSVVCRHWIYDVHLHQFTCDVHHWTNGSR